MKKLAITAALGLAASITSQAAIVWTGATSSALDLDGNWDFTGSALTSVAGITNATLADDIVFNNAGTAPIIGEQGAQPTWGVASGFSATIDNVFLNTAGNDGFSAGTTDIINGGSLSAFFIFGNTNVSGDSSINLLGGGDPLPGAAVLSLSPGSQITLASFAEFNEQGAQIFVNGVNYDTDNSVLDFAAVPGANSAIAVPEPSSTALIGLAGLGFILRRRK